MQRLSYIRVGILGLGKIAETRHLPHLTKSPHYQIVAAYDLDKTRAENMARRFQLPRVSPNAEEVLQSPQLDLILIFTPPTTHAALAHAALDAGKHVFVEKPLTLSLTEAQELVAHVNRSGKKLFVGFNQRRHRLVQQARQWLQENRLGEISALHSTLTNNHDPAHRNGWQSSSAQGGDLNFDVAVHHYDLWRYLLGSDIASVTAQQTRRADHAESLTLLAQTRNGIPITAVLAEATNEQDTLEIFGERGRLALSLYRFDGLEFSARGALDGSVAARAKRVGALLLESGVIARRVARGGDYELCYAAEWEHLAEVLDSIEYEPNVYDGLAATQTALAVRASLETNAPVLLDDLSHFKNSGNDTL